MNAVWIALAVAVSSMVGPLLLARQLNKQRQAAAKEKAEDRRREDEVAAEALRQQEEVRVEAARQQKEVAETAAKAAELLLEAQKETTRGTDEVARLAASKQATPKPAEQEATPVVLFFEDGQREDVVLAGVPRTGERIRIRNNGRGSAPLVVVGVLWLEAFLPPPNPSVVVVVRPEESDEETTPRPATEGEL